MNKYLKSYLNNYPLYFIFIRPIELELLASDLPYKKPILDFGCGDGFFANLLFGAQKIDIGFDVDEKLSKEKYVKRTYKKFISGDSTNLPFKKNYFNSGFSNCVFEHVIDPIDSLYEINRVMKKGGSFYLTVATNKWEQDFFGKILFGEIYLKIFRFIQNHNSLYSYKKWESIFKKSGFRVVRRTPYLDKRRVRIIEAAHFIMIPFAFYKKITGRIVRWKFIEKIFLNSKDVDKGFNQPIENAPCIYYHLKKV